MKKNGAGGRSCGNGALLRRLLATSSLASALAATGGAAQAACLAVSAAFTNSTTRSCITVTSTSFTGNLVNHGTLTPGGISLSAGTITGQIIDSSNGVIAGGINLDSNSKITTSATSGAIIVQGVSTFGGGVSSSGVISAAGAGIIVGKGSCCSFSGTPISVSTFSGGITNNGTVTAGPGAAIGVGHVQTFSGGINNAGSLISTTVSGGGIGVVSVQSFSGGISSGGTISGGGFGIHVASAQSFRGGISAGGTISVSRTGIAVGVIGTFAGGIVSSGTISSPNGIGITISNITSFGGGITSIGTIHACGDGIRVGSVSMFSGGISNGGTITGGSGNGITIFGVSTFQGTITNTGLVQGRIGIDVSGVSGVSIFDSGAIIGTQLNESLGGPIAINFDSEGGTNTLTLGRGYNIDGLVVGSGHDTLQFGGTGNGFFNLSTIGSATVGTGSHQQYRGFETFNVVGGTWTGFGTFLNVGQSNPSVWTVQNGGTLLVDGDLSSATSMTVQSGGTLGGFGTLPSTTILNGGTLAPGGPPCCAALPADLVGGKIGIGNNVLTIVGSLTMQGGANYLVDVSSTTATSTNVIFSETDRRLSSKTSVSIDGSASIGGTLIAVATGGPYTLGTKYTVLTAQGGVDGSFSSLFTTGGFGPFRPVISYDADDVFLTMQYALFTPVLPSNATINERDLAGALDAFTLGNNTLPPGFYNIFNFTPQQILNALNELTGEVGTGATQTGFQLITEFMDILFSGPGGPGGGGGIVSFAPDRPEFLPPDVASAYASVLKAPPRLTPRSQYSVWAAGFGGGARLDGDPAVVGSSDLTTGTFGMAAGLEDRISPDTKLGVAMAGAGAHWSLSGGLGSGDSDAIQLAGYGTRYFGPAYLSGAVAGGEFQVTTHRNLTGPALPADQLTANFSAQSLGERVEGGYRLAVPMVPFGVIPYAAVQVQTFWTPSYSETGLLGPADPFALAFSSRHSTVTRTELGSRFDQIVPTMYGPLGLFGRLAWAHDSQSNAAITPTFLNLPTPSFAINGAPLPRDKALVTAGAEWRLPGNWSLQGKFDGEFASHANTYTGTAQIKYTW